MTKIKLMKCDLINDIITILKWSEGKKEGKKVADVLHKHNISWSVSNVLMERKLNRISLNNLSIIRDDALEAIY